MLLASLLLLASIPQAPESSRTADEPVVIASNAAAPAAAANPALAVKSEDTKLPDAPLAKAAVTPGESSSALAGESIEAGKPFSKAPIKPALAVPYETPRQRAIWYGLMGAGHGAAAFDAWSTRNAVSAGAGTESNPLLRPFANSNAIYAVTQISPAVMDYLGHRMMTSKHEWMRRYWWVPQAAGAGVSFGAGMHNYKLTH